MKNKKQDNQISEEELIIRHIQEGKYDVLSSFEKRLVDTIQLASQENLDKLAKSYPKLVNAAIKKMNK